MPQCWRIIILLKWGSTRALLVLPAKSKLILLFFIYNDRVKSLCRIAKIGNRILEGMYICFGKETISEIKTTFEATTGLSLQQLILIPLNPSTFCRGNGIKMWGNNSWNFTNFNNSVVALIVSLQQICWSLNPL